MQEAALPPQHRKFVPVGDLASAIGDRGDPISQKSLLGRYINLRRSDYLVDPAAATQQNGGCREEGGRQQTGAESGVKDTSRAIVAPQSGRGTVEEVGAKSHVW